ncbi:hypothetical protein IWQ62_005493 [Dispira parvispora]|uniref:Uncharacterized protein n=1 Tax=Dispira parvispora TaxID=1520584 RepID=A0A9W8APV5_9FUNG|nr:hypothetical protein IWQ62_005493 [Dispira parvispora]
MRLYTFTSVTLLAALANHSIATNTPHNRQVTVSLISDREVVVKWKPDVNDETGENHIQVVLDAESPKVLGEAKINAGEVRFKLPPGTTLDSLTSLVMKENDQVLGSVSDIGDEKAKVQNEDHAQAQEGPSVDGDQIMAPLTSSAKDGDSEELQQIESTDTKVSKLQSTSATTPTATAPTSAPTQVVDENNDDEDTKEEVGSSGNYITPQSVSVFGIVVMSFAVCW